MPTPLIFRPFDVHLAVSDAPHSAPTTPSVCCLLTSAIVASTLVSYAADCCVQTILNDLKSMKVQIDAIVAKSETLKSESNSELYNRQLTDNGVQCHLHKCVMCAKN